MAHVIDPSLLGSLALAGLALALAIVGWVWAYRAGAGAALVSMPSRGRSDARRQLGPYTLVDKTKR